MDRRPAEAEFDFRAGRSTHVESREDAQALLDGLKKSADKAILALMKQEVT